jgi:hypothetical protein
MTSLYLGGEDLGRFSLDISLFGRGRFGEVFSLLVCFTLYFEIIFGLTKLCK